jgi:hypothetical protein
MDNEILVKDDVRFKKFNLPALKFLDVLMRCGNLLHRNMVITSANDGEHHGSNGSNSLHYQDRAWDIRTHHLTGQEQLAMEQYLRSQLGTDWDVVTEGIGTVNFHLHTEYDPK